jgi:hypothetical protein
MKLTKQQAEVLAIMAEGNFIRKLDGKRKAIWYRGGKDVHYGTFSALRFSDPALIEPINDHPFCTTFDITEAGAVALVEYKREKDGTS